MSGIAGCSSFSSDSGVTPTSASAETATQRPTPTATPSSTPTRTPTASNSPTPSVEVRTFPDAYYQGPLVSTHEHMNGPDGFWMTAEKLDWFIDWMRRNKVAQAMAITTKELAPTIEAHDDRLVPFLFPYQHVRNELDRLRPVLNELLNRYEFYEGLGEFALYRSPGPDGTPPLPANHPRLLEVYDLAAERDIPVMVHGGQRGQYGNPEDPVTDMEAAFTHNRDCTFLVHGTFHNVTINGETGVPIGEAVDILLDRHPNLYFDISGGTTSPYSYRYNEGPDDDYDTVNPREKKSQEWFESKLQADGGVEYHAAQLYDLYEPMLENHPDRVTWGMDASWQWHFNDWAMDTWVDVARALLGKLSRDKAEQVGYKTAAGLFRISVDQGT